MTDSLRFFRYVSRAKVDMLDSQLRRVAWPRWKGKAEFQGVSVEVSPPDEDLIRRAGKLRKNLEKRDLLAAIPAGGVLESSTYYADVSPWREGIFSFIGTAIGDDKRSSVATYVLWKHVGDAVVLLAGSPANVVGESIAREGVAVSGTEGTIAAVSSFAERVLKTDEGLFTANDALQVTSDDTIPIGWFSLPNGVALAVLCATHLQRLPEGTVDVVFRIFHRFDLSAAEWARRALHLLDGRADEETLRIFWNCRAVYLGSPIYTARA